jgi:2-haloacid dehalogenase
MLEAAFEDGLVRDIMTPAEELHTVTPETAIDDLLEDTVSADEIGTFKPDAALYRHAAARTGTPIEEIAHVSAGWFDVLGAIHAGMQGVWVDRKGRPWDAFGDEPTLVIEDFFELADALGV